jgi:hypothetical protein
MIDVLNFFFGILDSNADCLDDDTLLVLLVERVAVWIDVVDCFEFVAADFWLLERSTIEVHNESAPNLLTS